MARRRPDYRELSGRRPDDSTARWTLVVVVHQCRGRTGQQAISLVRLRPLGPWRPHPGNPVKVDVRSSRPAGGPFLFGGNLYRPAQDCSRTYGGGITINRVTHLSL